VDTTERGDSEVKGEGTPVKERMTLRITLMSSDKNISDFFVLKVSTFPKII
jgi:hypothetical protein